MNAEDFKSAGKNSPSQDFTSRLMQEIQAEDRALEQILRQHGRMETSPSFVASLEAQLEGQLVKKQYQPLFSTRSWILVACIALALLAISFLSGSSVTIGTSDVEWGRLSQPLNGFFQHYVTPYLVLPSSLLIMFAILRNPVNSKN